MCKLKWRQEYTEKRICERKCLNSKEKKLADTHTEREKCKVEIKKEKERLIEKD